MTQHQTTDTLPADIPTDPTTTRGDTAGEGVNAMAHLPIRRARGKRAWDEMSQTDREVLLESVRQRREAQAARDARAVEIYALRSNR